jgi:hypothetical protein
MPLVSGGLSQLKLKALLADQPAGSTVAAIGPAGGSRSTDITCVRLISTLPATSKL